jgi:GxxExxY protein
MGKVIYPELSYKLVGLMYEVYNELGYGYQEKYYQRAIEKYFQESKIKYNKELYCPIKIKEKNIGSYRLDFLIDDKIVLELKVANQVYIKHIKQVLGYLKQNNLKLGILSVFTKDGVKIQRILN